MKNKNLITKKSGNKFYQFFNKIKTSFYYDAFKIMFFGALFALFDNGVGFANNLIIGHYLSEASILAVSITLPITVFLGTVIYSIMTVSGVFTAQYLGMKDYNSVKQTVKFKIMFSVPIMTIVSIIVMFLAKPIVSLLLQHSNDANPELYNQALTLGVKYLKVIIWYTIPFAYVNAILYTLINYGKTKFSSLLTFCTLVISVVLSLLLTLGWGAAHRFGIIGPAISTIIATSFNLIFLTIYLVIKNPTFAPGWKLWQLNWTIVWRIIKKWPLVLVAQVMLGLSYSAQIIVFNVYGGPDLVAAASATFTLLTIAWPIIIGYIAVIQSYIGKELGSGKIAEAKKTSIKIIKLCAVTSAIFAGIYCSTSAWLLNIVYGKTLTPNALKLAKWFIEIQTFGFWCESVALVMSEIVRAGNKQFFVSWYEATFFWIFGVVAAIILFTLHVEAKYILMSLSLLQVFQIIITALMYKFIPWARQIEKVESVS